MSDWQADTAREEFVALRATIRDRSALRVVIFLLAVAAWGIALGNQTTLIPLPIASLVPLLLLAAGVEAVASLHVGVERIGRYVQARFESDPAPHGIGPAWERTMMDWGQRFPRTGTDPLFSVIFLLAVLLNYIPVYLAVGVWTTPAGLVAVLHGFAIWRILYVRAWARRQRGADLARFRELLAPRPAERGRDSAGNPKF
jgi:hypothetical protein